MGGKLRTSENYIPCIAGQIDIFLMMNLMAIECYECPASILVLNLVRVILQVLAFCRMRDGVKEADPKIGIRDTIKSLGMTFTAYETWTMMIFLGYWDMV